MKGRILLTLAVLLGAMQFVGPKPLNPVSQDRDSLEADKDAPAGITRLMQRSCMDCHSNHTHWRWYNYVAPVSWFINPHVVKGREKMNFSEWSSRRDSKGKVVHSVNDLEAVCDVVSKGTMPFRSYSLLHHDAVLSPDEKKAICDWTDRLASERRHAPAGPGGQIKTN